MRPRVLVTFPLAAAEQALLRELVPTAEFRFSAGGSTEVAESDLAWAAVIFGNVKPADRLLPHRNVCWLHSPNVGLDAYEGLAKSRPDLRITHARGVVDDAVAEHAIAMLLCLTRSVDLLVRAQQKRAWDRQGFMARGSGRVLAGKSVHVLGYGPIARCLIDKLLGLRMRVSVYRRTAAGDDPRVERFLSFDALPREAGGADVLVALLPDKPQTRRLIDGRVLGAMKPSAYVVNVGRGSALDEAALVEALSADRIAGAALDVFEAEPLAPSSALWESDKVLISPHVAGRFDQEPRRHVERFAELLRESIGQGDED